MAPFHPFELDGLIDAWDADDLVTHYVEGQCYELATVLSVAHGWPVHILADCNREDYWKVENGGWGMACHAVVQAGPDTFVDIAGAWRREELRETWQEWHGLSNMFRLPLRSMKGLEGHFKRLWVLPPGAPEDFVFTCTVAGKLQPQIAQLMERGHTA